MASHDPSIIASLRQQEARFLRNPIAEANVLLPTLEILEAPKDRNSSQVRLAALHSTRRAFSSLLDRSDLWEEDHEGTSALAFRNWVLDRFKDYFDALLRFVNEDSADIASPALLTALEFAKDHARKLRVPGASSLLEDIVRFLSHSSKIDDKLLSLVESTMFSVDGLLLRTLRAVRKVADDAYRSKGSSIIPDDLLSANLVALLCLASMPKSVEDLKNVKNETAAKRQRTGAQETSANLSSEESETYSSDTCIEDNSATTNIAHDSSSKKRRASRFPIRCNRELAKYRGAFEAAWLAILKLPLRAQTYKRVLLRIPEHVLQHMAAPTKLADFLMDSYKMGGVTSVLALSSLFILMRYHNLDCPNFYDRLYKTLQPSIFYAKHRVRFFRLLTICLTTSSIPIHVTGAFLKK